MLLSSSAQVPSSDESRRPQLSPLFTCSTPPMPPLEASDTMDVSSYGKGMVSIQASDNGLHIDEKARSISSVHTTLAGAALLDAGDSRAVCYKILQILT